MAIEAVAYRLLAEKGYRRTSMLSVAKAANASNQTLYRWYGSKQGLFGAMIERHASEVSAALRAVDLDDLDEGMARFGAVLLAMLTGPKGVALDRAAAADADETGELGSALNRASQELVLPALWEALGKSLLDASSQELAAAAEYYVALLVGDLQVRRATGAVDPLEPAFIDARARYAWTTLSNSLG